MIALRNQSNSLISPVSAFTSLQTKVITFLFQITATTVKTRTQFTFVFVLLQVKGVVSSSWAQFHLTDNTLTRNRNVKGLKISINSLILVNFNQYHQLYIGVNFFFSGKTYLEKKLFRRFSLRCTVIFFFFYSAARPLHGRFPTKQFVNKEMYCSTNLAKKS